MAMGKVGDNSMAPALTTTKAIRKATIPGHLAKVLGNQAIRGKLDMLQL